MTEKQFMKKIKVLYKQNKKCIEQESIRLFKSGGVDTEEYGDNFALPKIIFTCALQRLASAYEVMSRTHKEEVEELQNF